MKLNLEYVLKNYMDHRFCELCGATWFKFLHTDNTFGVYRLGKIPPEKCLTCKPVDEDMSKDLIYSVEKWIKEGEEF